MKKIIFLIFAFSLAAFCFAEGTDIDFSALTDKNSITVKNGGKTSLERAVEKAQTSKKKVIVVDGSDGAVKSGTVKITGKGITVVGINNAEIDFSDTFKGIDRKLIEKAVDEVENGGHAKLAKIKNNTQMEELRKKLGRGRGFEISGSGNVLKNLKIKNASSNGVYINGSNNTFENLELCYNHDSGLQLSRGASNNKVIGCYAHDNFDEWNGGENADGFACKMESGEGNIFENCKSEYNADDGWDLFAASGSVTIINCEANYSGLRPDGSKIGYYSNGNGFKLGGVNGSKAYEISKTLHHVAKNCSAKGNLANGFDRNNQFGEVTLENCVADSNKGKNFNWPDKGAPSSLVNEGFIKKENPLPFGKAYLFGCTSINGTNNIKGAVLDENCKGF